MTLLHKGMLVEVLPAFDSDGVELDQLGGCEGCIEEVHERDVLLSFRGGLGDTWVSKRRIKTHRIE